ncbi:molybdate ABC transporter substrate-binding protein [Desulfotomaculum copahuensis]|uniref:Molybdate ABC transporter substrate-binding protein n=1 Tax=Desulfotomaculum copahuensis TaxID=1838280 RepID=A0A1B7LBB0_9FIRM|nr:molybdate ABC transporter substrate-binding protein [Desulfotomaculum copahuensis]OAT79531.1 molybdate ABC transporter substrate-binding protein [Desulfotomaculum copahuensis]
MSSNKPLRITMLFLVMIVLLATGCGRSTNPKPDQPGSKAGVQGSTSQATGGKEALLVYSGAGLRKPMDEIGRVFTKKTGIPVTYTYAGAGQNNSQILLTKKGDVCIPGDITELNPLKKENLVGWNKKVVYHRPALAVPKGNPAGIHSLADLARPGVKVVLGDPKANPMGKLSDAVLKHAGLLEKVDRNVVARTPTINELLIYLSMKQADAAIIGAENYPGFKDKVDLVPVPELEKVSMVVPVAVLTCSKQSEKARQFAEFVASNEARAIWKKNGFKPY